VGLGHLEHRLAATVPPVFVDLLEVAAFVYAADQALTRGGPKEIDYGDKWRRHLRFEIPVRQLDIWARPDVRDALRDVLSFLLDDHEFEFGFRRLTDAPNLDAYLFDSVEASGKVDCEEVILFSGGLDSLGGAVQEILQGHRKVVLVGHNSVSKVVRRQRELADAIGNMVNERRLRPVHVPVNVNKGKRLGREFTQRSRSFLFMAIAAPVAQLFGRERIRFYENGVTSLNLPISLQIIGGRTSRTTHPRVLRSFEQLLTLLAGHPFEVENPFQWQTKIDLLRQIKAAGHAALCASAVSCGHTIRQTIEHPHCGRCSQCVDRRLCALAAGLNNEEDPPGRYASDVLTGPRDGADLVLVERYYGTALRIERIMDTAAFVSEFPEVSDAVRYLNLTPSEAARKVYDLARRHASAVCEVLGGAVAEYSDQVVRRAFPGNSLLGVASGRSPRRERESRPVAVPTNSTTDGANQLVIDPERFEARLGSKVCPLGNTYEFALLNRLNGSRGRYVEYDHLRDDVWGDIETEKNTIQRTVSNLRRKLREAGMTAVVIDGKQKGHYRLEVETSTDPVTSA
jgi:7-cyano-7-deazaguanine synthase in queuosine biosynthesis/DNA-binding winged helix-turn-helix (wHTH) protein